MGYVFISYSHKDSDYAHMLWDDLRARGFDAWIDDRIDYGTQWPKVIEDQVDGCDAFIVVASRNSSESEWVQNEITRAQRKQKKVYPILLSGDTWISIESRQYVNATSGQLPPDNFYEQLAQQMGQTASPPAKLFGGLRRLRGPKLTVGLSIAIVTIPILWLLFRPGGFVSGEPTPTVTFTSGPTETVVPTVSPSPKPESDYIHYMIVYDSSLNMDGMFHGQKKWSVVRNMLIEIMNGLNPRARYSMVTVGGPSDPSPNTDRCKDPAAPSIPFSSKQGTYEFLAGLQPQGGGSFYRAFVTAKNQLQDLPRDTIRTLIFITGVSDTCESEDEWDQIQALMSVPDSTFGIYSQIIILDEDGVKARTLAEQFNSLGNENIQAAAPVSLSELQGNGVTLVQIVNNVNTYITNNYYLIETPTPTTTLTRTATLPPGVTPPTSTRTLTPTLAPTLTRTSTPSLTASPVPPVCPSFSHPYLGGPGYGGSVYISAPGDCTTGYPPESAIGSGGGYSDIPAGTVIWELVYAENGLYYPQSPNACAGGPPPNQGGGSWSVNTYLGTAGENPRWYELVVVLTDQSASDFLSNWLVTNCGNFPGIDPAVLSSMNITEKASIRVRTN